MRKRTRWFRYNKSFVEEYLDGDRTTVYVDGKLFDGTFHEANISVKQAPLIAMRDECRRMAEQCEKIVAQNRAERLMEEGATNDVP